MDKTIEECSVLELKGVLYELLAQQEKVRALIKKKINEEQVAKPQKE